MMATTTTPLKMKLLIDTKENRVLFAEANKDVVDFLFSLLSLPVARIASSSGYVRGSVGNLWHSVWDLDEEYILPNVEKITLLYPKVVPSAANTSRSSLLLPAPSSEQPKSFFLCWNRCDYVTDRSSATCPRCGYRMNSRVQYIDGSGDNVQMAMEGFVQAAVTYTVRDDLTVTPMSNISSIALFSNLGVTDFSVLQEKTVQIGRSEGLKILKASLLCKTVLTDVFLRKYY